MKETERKYGKKMEKNGKRIPGRNMRGKINKKSKLLCSRSKLPPPRTPPPDTSISSESNQFRKEKAKKARK
jgi:hypothetical protein